MDRVAAMLILLAILVAALLTFLAIFSMAPICCSCIVSLLYTLYLFIANEESGVHHAQEFENRFWTIFTALLSTVMFFAKDSPIAFGIWNPSLGFLGVVVASYGMHIWDRHIHRQEIGRVIGLRRPISTAQSLVQLKAMGVPVEDQLAQINSCLEDIDQLLIPSTINNIINERFILRKEREIITIFEEAGSRALNYIIQHCRLGLLFYKVKDHRNFTGQHRTELIELLAVARISVLTVVSRVIVLHALQMMKIPANIRAEYWVRNILLNTHQDDLSELKTLTDSKGDYFCMSKLIYEDIRSETVRQDILAHIRKESAIQQAHMDMNTKKSKLRRKKAWRKVLSDVDDTLTCSAGSYPAGIDKRYGKKVVYPGVLAFYRELDLGTQGPEEWPEHTVGNLVFLSARPHLYKDVSEKKNFAKFEKLRSRGGEGGRGNMHTVPSLLAGDLSSGSEYIINNDFEPLAVKKLENFKRYISIYPEFKHVFICDNGQGDVRAGELTFDLHPKNFEAIYVHVVQDRLKTYGYEAERWRKKGMKACFFTTYPDAALDAATRKPPLIRVSGLRRVCQDAVADFYMIQTKEWPSLKHKVDRRNELNQGLWRVNKFLASCDEENVPFIEADRIWKDGQKVCTPYGIARVLSFDPIFDMYAVEIDWRPLDVQIREHKENEERNDKSPKLGVAVPRGSSAEGIPPILETVVETSEEVDEENGSNEIILQADLADSREDCAYSPLHDSCVESQLENGVASATSVTSQLNAKKHDDTQGTAESLPVLVQPGYEDEKSLTNVSKFSTITASTFTSLDKQGEGSLEGVKDVEKGDGSSDILKNDDVVSNGDNVTESKPSCYSCKVIARIKSGDISSYTPPAAPILPKEGKGRSIFSFWVAGGENKNKGKHFTPGEKCNTPFGPATIVEHRGDKGIVVVNMIGWKAQASLQEKCIKTIEKRFLSNILKIKISGITDSVTPAERAASSKPVEFPLSSTIQTPFGTGTISRPLPAPKIDERVSKGEDKAIAAAQSKDAKKETGDRSSIGAAEVASSPTSTQKESKQESEITTLGISLSSWTHRDGSHPTLYCTPEMAREWKKFGPDGRPQSKGIFSVFGSLVSGTVGSLRRITRPTEKTSTTEVQARLYERYYKNGAAVTTPYGDGTVNSFREADGFYDVSLVKWRMKDGFFATVHIRKDDLSYRIAKGCHEGYPVLTSLGLSGTLASVEPTTGVHLVTVPSCGMVCYLKPEDVIQPLKAAVGEDVLSAFGEGKIKKYRPEDEIYEISLKGCNGTLYARGETFDRVANGMEERGSFGMKWILRYFFSTDDKNKGPESQRSRSNSIASLSVVSQSGTSVH